MIKELILPLLDRGVADVLDVGSGAGELVRWMRARGARAIGLECGDAMIAQALEVAPDQRDHVMGVGEALPFPTGTFDLVVFSYSLHHVPVEQIPSALHEARRVLRPAGRLLVIEPIADDPDNVVAYPAVDERVEQAVAQDQLAHAVDFGLRLERSAVEESEGIYESFEAWLDMIVGVDPARAAVVEEHREQHETQFHEIGHRREDGWVFLRRSNVAELVAI